MQDILKRLKPCKKYIAKREEMGGQWYWMIYRRVLWFDFFVERCNTEQSCIIRLRELRYPEAEELDL